MAATRSEAGFTGCGCIVTGDAAALLYWSVVQRHIQPYQQQSSEQARREEQRRVYRRNQVFGLLMVAAAICAWWMVHTNPKWIFPPGWWRW